jgi:hypothetical protein
MLSTDAIFYDPFHLHWIGPTDREPTDAAVILYASSPTPQVIR